MKIYTRTGDDGTTGLIGGARILKSDPRLECYGTIDELNASLGLALASASGPTNALLPWLRTVQNELFVIGSHLATPENSPHREKLPALEESMVQRLETQIDEAEKQLPPLRNFILPGGTELSSRLHLARTICRRAERLLVGLSSQSKVEEPIIRYLNRLSDWLFVQARWANKVLDVEDIPWLK